MNKTFRIFIIYAAVSLMLIVNRTFSLQLLSRRNLGFQYLKMSTKSVNEKIDSYFALPIFVVLGASADKSKFGYKVLKCLVENNKQCIPINKKVAEIDGIPTISSLSNLKGLLSQSYNNVPLSNVGMNIITPPGVTLLYMKEAYNLGIRNFFLQPGTSDEEVEEFIKQIENESKCNIIHDCVLVRL